MEPETLIFMPNGDVTLRLVRNILEEEDPGTAIEDEQRENAPALEPEPPANPDEADDAELFYAPDAPDSDIFAPPPRRAARRSDASSQRDRSTSPPASFWSSLKRQQAKIGEPSLDVEPVTQTTAVKKERAIVSSHEVLCIVSSRHMMLASRYFEKLLGGDSNEAVAFRSKKHISIPMSADLDAMIILLNIVHGVSRKVPRQVTLETLRKLATLVSALGMIDAVQFFSDTWIDDFQRKGLPSAYNEKVLSLLFVFWVFDRQDEFKNMTKITQRECDEYLNEDAQDIPIARSIIDAIKRDRELAMESAIEVIHKFINKYLDGKNVCDGAWEEDLAYACDATVLGSLMKSARKIGIWPKPEVPFPGLKFKDLAQSIRSIKVLDVCKKSSSRRLHLLGPSNNSHGLEDKIEAALKSIEAGMDGLELADYAKKSDEYPLESEIFLPATTKVELDEPENEIAEEFVEEQYPSYDVNQEMEGFRRKPSVSLSMISTHPDPRSVEPPRQEEVNSAPIAVEGGIQEISHPLLDNGKADSRKYWNHEAEEPVYDRKTVVERNTQSQDVREPVRQSGKASSKDSSNKETERPVYDRVKTVPADSREQDVMEYIKRQTQQSSRSWTEDPVHAQPTADPRNTQSEDVREPVRQSEKAPSKASLNQETKAPVFDSAKIVPTNSREQDVMEYIKRQTQQSSRSWTQVDDPVPAQPKTDPRNSWSGGMQEPVHEQEHVYPRNSWNHAKEPVIEQRKPSPRSALSQERRSSPTVAKSPVEQPDMEVKASADRRPNSNTSFPRDEVKSSAPESHMAPRNSSTERVKAMADKALRRTPSFKEEVRPQQQQPVAPSTSLTEEVRILPDTKSYAITSNSRNEIKAPVVPKVASTEEVRVLADKRPNRTNPFTNGDSNVPSSQPPMSPRRDFAEDAPNENRRPNTTNPFAKDPNNEAKSPIQTPSVTPRVPSREEVAALTNKKLTMSLFPDPVKDNGKVQKPSVSPRTASTEEVTKIREISSQVSLPERKDIKAPKVEIRQASSDALLSTEDEETAFPPQKFNMRKSKKKFQVKY